MSQVRIKKGVNEGNIYKIDKSVILGRDSNAGIQIHDKAASREHAEIFKLGEMYFIRDLQSRNGTLVNGKLIDEELLREGDVIQIGETEIGYEEFESSDNIEQSDNSEDLLFDDSADLGSTMEFHLGDLAGKSSAPTSKESENLKTIYQIGKVISSEVSGSRLLEEVLGVVLKKIDADNVYIFTKDQDTGKFKMVAKKVDPVAGDIKVSRTIIKKAINETRAIMTNNAMSDERFDSKDSIVLNKIRSVICAPLLTQHKVNGVLYVSRNRPGEGFISEDLELATAVGTMVGLALENLRSRREQHELFINMIKTLISAGELRQPDTKGHSERVSAIAVNVGRQMKLSMKDVMQIRISSLLHDVGKIGLTAVTETSDMQDEESKNIQNITNAEKILQNLSQMDYVIPSIKHQFETYNGKGIPDSLKGDDIPLFARIISVANAFDLLTTTGGDTGEGLPIKDAIAELKVDSGKKFDPEVVIALIEASEEGTLFADDMFLSVSS